MQPVHDVQLGHLLELCRQYRNEQFALATMLEDARDQLERSQRELTASRLRGEPADPSLQHECTELQEQQDRLAMELAHVRLAVLGVSQEIASQIGRPELLSA